ncbi:MAG: hypothetical protein ACRD02_08815 [Acidimicrobiia bacterium]
MIAAAVVVYDASAIPEVAEAFARQVYEPAAVFVVGGDGDCRRAAEEHGLRWVEGSQKLLAELPAEVTHVWMVHDDARPRPDALAALVRESERVQASVAGSKLLHADHPEVLESVGAATDVFDVPYFGLERGELDQQQYDVVRDVAFVSTASLLVRTDLLRGLGGPDPRLPAESAAIDFCQRARLAGARVVVAPSSEVLHAGSCRARGDSWREEAGRIRAMLKAYSRVTLLWSLPLAFAGGLIEGVVASFLGRRAGLVEFARAWAWNAIHLPETLRIRRQVLRSRRVGDEELFRYQLRGSSRLRRLGEEMGERVRARAAEGMPGTLAGLFEMGQEAVHHPGFVGLLSSMAFVAFATREVWAGTLPIAGYALPPAESAWDTLRAYAGGWNVAGLGSPEPLRPAVGAVALAQVILLGRSELTAAALTVASMLAGIVGTARLLRRFAVGAYARWAAGVVLVGGPPARAMLTEGHWPSLMALAGVPWVVLAALRLWPPGWRRRVGRLGLLGLSSGVVAVFTPGALAVPTLALAARAAVGDRHLSPALRAAAGGGIGLVFLLPWLWTTDPVRFATVGVPAFWTPSWWTLALFAGAVGAVLAGGERRLVSLGGWGALVALLGAFAARSGGFGLGQEVGLPGLIAASLGMAVVAGSALEMWARVPGQYLWRRAAALAGMTAALALVAGALLLMAGGRAGLPADRFGEALRFTAGRQAEEGSSRILLLGPPETLAGESRSVDGAAYRLVAAPAPRLWEAWLPAPRAGDRQLEEVLRALGNGQSLRVGESLAPFGVRWVILTGPTPFEQALDVQLDLQPLSGLRYPAFENEAPGYRAVAEDGTAWRWAGPGYTGPPRPEGRVYLAENADQGWSPGPWEQVGWANEVSASAGEVTYQGDGQYRLIVQALGLLALVLAALAWWGRGEHR